MGERGEEWGSEGGWMEGREYIYIYIYIVIYRIQGYRECEADL